MPLTLQSLIDTFLNFIAPLAEAAQAFVWAILSLAQALAGLPMF